ncbi:MAG: nuclear transport factor 2 family protein [Gemmatimonadetes bacterium]|nr:nuclear transport factor 2 family protein [Gemmatimonadota bacterium]
MTALGLVLALSPTVTSAQSTSAQPPGAQSPSALSDVVRDREIAFAQSMADRDHDAFASFLSADAIFFNGERAIRGADAVAADWARYFEGPDAPFSWTPDVVEVLDSGDLALSSGPVLNPAGEQVGRFNSIWRLEADGIWRVVFDKGS